MSKRSNAKDDGVRKTSSRMPTTSSGRTKPSLTRPDPKELFSYTPNWITPQEKAKLRARVKKMKMTEQRLMQKEDSLLVRAMAPEDENKSVTSADADVKQSKSEKSLKSRSGSVDSNKGDVKKEKSKESVKSGKDGKGKGKEEKNEKKKSKEDLRMSKKNEQPKGSHPREAHANPSGNTMEGKPQREVSKNDLYDHLWATIPHMSEFDPQLYHFKSPEKLSTKNPVLAECPPFWVLLDHTIAVTWKLFSQNADRKDLGIIPLQWSREFLSAMRDERGEYLPATGQLLSAVEDALIDRYAKAGDGQPEDDDAECKRVCSKSDKSDCKKEQDNLSYVSSESIFKHPVEVSYTLKDIMSRNMPGRTLGNADSVHARSPAVNKVDVPPPEDHETMSRADMLKYLKQLKEEQNLRVEKEKEHIEKIEALIDLLAKGKLDGDLWAEGHDAKKKQDKEHVHFTEKQEDESEESKQGKGKKDGKEKDKGQKKGSKEDKKKGSAGDGKKGSAEDGSKKGSVEDGKKKEGKKVQIQKGSKEEDEGVEKRKSDASIKSNPEA